METTYLLVVIATAVFYCYTIAMFRVFGIPESYSNTFYLLNEKLKGLGILFPAMCAMIVFFIIPHWFVISDRMIPNFTFLCFFGGAGLGLVAASPFFKEMERETGTDLQKLIYRSFHGQGLVHTIGALVAMISSVAWTLIAHQYVLLIAWSVAVLVIMLSIGFKKTINTIVFWVEFLIFNLIFSINLFNI